MMVAELVVGVVSAQWLGEDHLSGTEWLGGSLIALGALLEALDTAPASGRGIVATKACREA